ncbi:unnamed protein product [Cylicocyclus nassatus]|uniref:G-protein coupled receptors family 1 profile domain-containing protein n=1 Tax=Cylicocyclus nassatus TaxID=53992 RepID=A0AA36GJZ9_CYLNA|nr:unnamed protein product [Cylicocyclus nassatus]
MLIAIACLLAMVLVTFSHFLSPCCRIIANPLIYSYEYLKTSSNTSNLSMLIVGIPLNIGTSFYCIISYSVLFIYIHRTSASENVQTCKRREMRCCIQFLLMFLTYTFVWLTFFLRPALDIPYEEIYSFTLISLVANCGVNSIIYLTMNTEVRGAANKILGKEIFSTRVTSKAIHFTHHQS